ncbi:MAG: hypothetical protein AAB686_02595 [Patescibacteria group bacterium]
MTKGLVLSLWFGCAHHPERKSNGSKGYIALVSSLLISAAILVLVTTVGLTSFFTRSSLSDASLKTQSRALAEACVQKALLSIAENPGYAGNETVPVGGESCRIISVVASGTDKVISTTANFRNSVTNFKVESAPTAIVSWEELSKF